MLKVGFQPPEIVMQDRARAHNSGENSLAKSERIEARAATAIDHKALPTPVPANAGVKLVAALETYAPPDSKPLNPGVLAVAAAYALKTENVRVSLQAACRRAGVDRKNVALRYPKEAGIIRAMSSPDGNARRGTIDRRTGAIEAIDEAEE